MSYSRMNTILGWVCGIIACTVYILTTESSVSWWDTGEFIASAYKLEVVHQPGAPLFLMIQNIFSNLGFGNTEWIAYWMNFGSALCSGLTIVFLFWTITALARKLLLGQGNGTSVQHIQILCAGVVGALAYSFTDTFWFSAVESEVYAMSSLCTAVVFWLALKWERRADESDANKWLLLIAFVMGLSIGVHLLNLLTIPALALLIYFRKAKSITWQGAAKSFGWGVLVLALILWGVIQYTVRFAAFSDLFFVNTLGLPFGTGIAAFVLLLIAVLVTGIVYSIKKNKPVLNLALLSLCFVYFGFTSYTMLLVRAQTNISLNNYDPDDAFSFLSYLSREQYQSEPLLKGPTFTSQVIGVEDGKTYRKDEKRYAPIDFVKGYSYDKQVLFPRMYSSKHADFYRQYLGLGADESPSFVDNMKFFFGYQVGHMYSRYFFWNFVGRQNDVPSQGEATAGNWLSGIDFVDEIRLPGISTISDDMRNNPSRATYFFLPLLLGIVGILWQVKKNKRDAGIVALLFFFTGLAIVLYLNQTPVQPRERDYAYAGSFYMFAIWIGLGVLGVMDFLQRRSKLSVQKITYATAAICMLAGPVLLLKENWVGHDRSGRKMTRELALNTLQSCDPNAILFTYGDNDTFPLWYLQEVEGIRTDVRVINYGYLSSDWYVEQMMQDMNASKAVPIGFSYDKVKKGIRDGIHVYDMGIEGYTDVDMLLNVMLSDSNENKVQLQDGSYINVLPTRKMQLKVDKDAVLAHVGLPKEWQAHIPEYMQWEFNEDVVSRADLSLMSILVNNNWERPIYYTSFSPNSIHMGLDKYLASEGLVNKLMPVDVGQPNDRPSLVNAEKIYANAMEKFQWSDISDLDYFDVDSNFYYDNWIYSDVYESGMYALVQQGETGKAKQLALKAYAFQPKNVRSARQSFSNVVLLDTLVKVKEMDKAKMLATKHLKAIVENLDYQAAILQKANTGYDLYAIRLGVGALEQYLPILKELGDEQLLATATQMDKKYKAVFM